MWSLKNQLKLSSCFLTERWSHFMIDFLSFNFHVIRKGCFLFFHVKSHLYRDWSINKSSGVSPNPRVRLSTFINKLWVCLSIMNILWINIIILNYSSKLKILQRKNVLYFSLIWQNLKITNKLYWINGKKSKI